MKKEIAIITGANSGLGKEFVKLLNEEKNLEEIWAIARDNAKLNELVSIFGNKIKTISMDLSDRKNIDILKEKLSSEDVSIKFLINNAGYGKFCSYKELSPEASLNMIDLNIGAVVALGLVCIPYMQKGSHIINIASQAAFFPLPYLNIYSATKTFVLHYTQALNEELKEKGITATAVCPGWLKTNFIDRCKMGAEKEVNNFFGITEPVYAAQKAIEDAKKGKTISICSKIVSITYFFSKLLPASLIMKFWLRMQNIK